MLKPLKTLFVAILLGALWYQPLFALAYSPVVGVRNFDHGKKSRSNPDDKAAKSNKNRKDTRASKTGLNGDSTNKGKGVKGHLKTAQKAELEGQTATRLPDGRWLLLGGRDEKGIINLATIKDENSGTSETLSTGMKAGRAGHSATLLPNGKVLILGGFGSDGGIINFAELFDPQASQFEAIDIANPVLRAYHSATLLTDGWVLIAGGADSLNKPIRKAELINSDNFEKQALDSKTSIGRINHSATVEGDGTVFLKGGLDRNSNLVSFNESFNPETKSFTIVGDMPPDDESSVASITFSAPANGDTSVSVNTRAGLRFSKLVKVEDANSENVRLTYDGNVVESKTVAAENGRLVFISPTTPLKPNTTYHIELTDLHDQKALAIPDKIIAFKTEGVDQPEIQPTIPGHQHSPSTQQTPIVDEDSWIPGDNRFKNKSVEIKAAPLEAPKNVTALSGRVLSISGRPLEGVTIVLQGNETQTDPLGRFLLTDLKPGQSPMTIHGDTVDSPGKTFGSFETLVDIDEGKTNVLPYTSYLTVIDKQNEVALDAPTRRETVVTTPRVPGMEVRIAADSVLKMPPGHGMSMKMADMNSGHQMTKVGITPIPAERPPFPLPPGVDEALVFTLQMHGAKVQGPNGEKRRGLRFTFPNSLNQPPKSRVSFWNYDSTAAGWAWYGYGTVTDDGARVVPDAGVELAGMQCLSLMSRWFGYGPAGGPGQDGDPVDLQTGLFVYQHTDLVLPDTIPINITRTYRQNDGLHSFGIGFTNPYDMFIAGDTFNYGSLILPDGGSIKFVHDTTNTSEWVGIHTATPSAFYKAELRYIGGIGSDTPEGAWEIRMKDGTRMIFVRKTIWGDILGIHSSITALTQIIDRFGNKLTMMRDDNLRLLRITSTNNKWVEFSYNGTSNIVTQIRDNIGRTVSYTYDNLNRLTKVTDVEGGETFYTYDDAHRMLTMKDPRGVVNLTNEYDFAGRVKKQTTADGQIYQFAYFIDPNSLKLTQTDITNPRGLIHRMNFNDGGFPTSETFGVGRQDAWGFTYERESISNRPLRITDSLGQKTAFNYDEFGNMLSTTYLEGTPDAITSSATYTDFNNVATTTDVLNRTSSFSYDGLGQLTSAADWLNRTSSFTYNDRGQVLTATDNLDRTSRFTYDRGTLTQAQDPAGRIVRRYSDNAGRITRTYDPFGGETKYRYNKFNYPIEATDQMGRTGNLLHDSVGNILEITDSRGNKIKYTFDSMGRPLTRTDQLNHVETYQYDAYGNLWKATDLKGQITEFTYDIFNRPTLVKYGDNSTTAYSYDDKGRVQSVADSSGGTITYGYDVFDRLNSETTSNGTVNYTFDAGSRLASMKAPNQPIASYTYDTADRIQAITQGGQTVSFTYDDADRRSTMTLPNGIVAYYSYDTVSALKSMSYKLGTTVLGDVNFNYDSNGRRTHVSGSLAQILSPVPFENASYDAANRQNSVNSQGLTYDQNGNLTSDGTNSYTWNARDELVSISGPSLAASFAYDGDGRRISKTINGIATTYVYDGLQAVEEHQSSGPITTQLAGGLDEVFFRKTADGANTSLEYLLTDAIGSTWGMADQSGNVNTQYKYDVFGDTQQTGQASSNSLQFAGRENDATGLYYYRNRYYAPALRRFISRDPLKEATGENEYSYVGNNPVSFTDPLGLIQDGPVNYLRDPFPIEYWPLNGASNTVSDLLDLDAIARSAWTLGDYCRPLSERLWAAAHITAEVIMTVFGEKIIKGVGSAIFKRIPVGPLSRALAKACFVKGTPVHTKDGIKPIEEIKAGDDVLSYNTETGRTEYKPVTETFVRETGTIIKLQIQGESGFIETTPEHPFYVKGQLRDRASVQSAVEWLGAGSLKTGDQIFTENGTWVKILGVEQLNEKETVYNLTAADNHDYFVGIQGALVHNIDCTDLARKLQRQLGGEILRVKPITGRGPLYLPKGIYPDGARWAYHDVHVVDGLVRDELSTFGKTPVPLETWMNLWDSEVTRMGKHF